MELRGDRRRLRFAIQVVVGQLLRSRAREQVKKAAARLDGCEGSLVPGGAEVLVGIEHGCTLAMTRESHVSGMAVVVRCREHVGVVDGRTLCLVNGGGVPVVKILIEMSIDSDALVGAVDLHLEHAAFHALDGTERAVLDPKRLLIPEEIEPVADSELPGSSLGLYH